MSLSSSGGIWGFCFVRSSFLGLNQMVLNFTFLVQPFDVTAVPAGIIYAIFWRHSLALGGMLC
jgi:ABC-type sulfate transport system permease subunit